MKTNFWSFESDHLNRSSVTGQHLYSKTYRTVVHLDIYLCRFFLIVVKE